MNNLRILIADDHPFFRDGIRQMLAGHPGIILIDEASSGEEVLSKLKEKDYDLVIMDIKMPGLSGIEATREIKKSHPNVKVLAMSMYDEQPYITKMMKAGASGYLLKNSGKEELLNGIINVMEGENYFSKDLTSAMMTQLLEGKPLFVPSNEPDEVTLTKREIEIIRLIAEEQTNIEISNVLGIAPRTVDSHRRNIMQKLRVKNTAGLVKYAIKKGWIVG